MKLPSISSIQRPIRNTVGRIGTAIMDSNLGQKLMPENPTDIAKTLALISTTTKDIVNCYYYTTQSYNNKKIEESQRLFVAGYDLANGIINTALQLTLGLWVNKNSGKAYEKIFKGGFVIKEKTAEEITTKVNKFLASQNIKASKEDVMRLAKSTNGVIKAGFGVLAVLVATQIIAKRVISPFLSTPVAGWFKSMGAKVSHKGKENNDGQKVQTNANIMNVALSQSNTFKGFEQFLK